MSEDKKSILVLVIIMGTLILSIYISRISGCSDQMRKDSIAIHKHHYHGEQ